MGILKRAQMMMFVFARTEKILEKGENASYKHFLHFLQCFKRYVNIQSCLKLGVCGAGFTF